MPELARHFRFRRWVARKLRQRGSAARLSMHLHHTRNWARRYVNGEFDIDLDTATEIVTFFEATMSEALGDGGAGRPPDDALDEICAAWSHLHPVLRHALLDDARFYASLQRQLSK